MLKWGINVIELFSWPVYVEILLQNSPRPITLKYEARRTGLWVNVLCSEFSVGRNPLWRNTYSSNRVGEKDTCHND